MTIHKRAKPKMCPGHTICTHTGFARRALSEAILELEWRYILLGSSAIWEYTGADVAETFVEFPGGGTARISGTPQEIADVLRLAGMVGGLKGGQDGPVRRAAGIAAKKAGGGPVGLILDLKAEGFFATERAIGEVQRELRVRGHIYALTSLSPALIRLVRHRDLGRVKGPKGRWVYVER
jgi:hypothetical protein